MTSEVTKKYTTDLPYISLVFCPSYDHGFKEEVLEKYGIDFHDYKHGRDWIGNASSAEELFEELTYDLDELLTRFRIRTQVKV